MLDNYCASNGLSLLHLDDFEALSSKYEDLLPLYSVRTNNVLAALQGRYETQSAFFDAFIKMSRKEIAELRNCGRKTIDEILSIQSALNLNNEEESNDIPHAILKKLPDNIDDVLPLFLAITNGLSTRSENRINWLLEECNFSLAAFYERICDPDCIKSIPTIGRKSTPEIKDFFVRARVFLEQFPDEESVSSRVKRHLIASPTALGLPDEAMGLLREQEETLGYFPMFAAIQMYLDNQTKEKKALIDGCLCIHQGQELPDRDEVAALLKLSPERVRQKRNKLIGKLPDYFKTYCNLGFITENPYRYQMTHYEDDVNAAEGTDFNLNFITWVLGCVFDDLTLIGDPVKSIGGYFDIDKYLCIVPTSLTRLFDFEAFIEDLESKMQEKRMGEEKVNLKSLINAHLKVQYCEDELPEIETTCRSILYLHFPVEVDLGNVILPSNAYKTNQFILEEILRAAGHPMMFDELYEEYMYEYPERNSTESSLRGAIGGNKNIVPFGRSSTYGLAEWNNNSYRGGTIREFVQEFIDSTPEGIATTAAITEYVLQFRPDTNEQNIVSNISLDPNKTFAYYYKEGERYLGYADRTYPLDYFPFESDFRTAIANSIYFPQFLRFVEANRRYPFTVGYTEEESQLRRFWIKQESRYRKNEMDHQAVLYFEKIEHEYGQYKIEKSEYEWRVQLAHAAAKYGFTVQEDAALLEVTPLDDIDVWLTRNLKDFFYRQKYMPEYRIVRLTPFAEYLKERLGENKD